MNDAVAEHRRVAEQFPASPEAQYNLGNALCSAGAGDEAIECYRRAIGLKADFAEAHSNLGVAFERQNRWADATECYRRATELMPTNAEAQNNLGNVLTRRGRFDQAIGAYRRALSLRPAFATAQYNLGFVLQVQGDEPEAEVAYRRALELDPCNAAACNNLANVLRELGDLDEAAQWYERALNLVPGLPQARWSRALLLLLRGDFQRGWSEYELRWEGGELAPRVFDEPRWNGEALQGRSVLLWAEQGSGDTFQFIRYAPLVKERGGTVVVECQKPLVGVLARCRGIDRLIGCDDARPPIDFHSPLLSLPRFINATWETVPARVPYVFADDALVTQWRARLASVEGFRIGINWAGRAGPGPYIKRDIPIEHFEGLTAVPGMRLISLQKRGGSELQGSKLESEKREVGGAEPTILDFGEELDREHGAFMDTAAIMMNLDLVITSDTSVAHLAGALGVPVWVALPFVPDWRWMLQRSDSPWYPTMRLFRQRTRGDWAGVFREIEAELRERIQK